MANNFVNAIKSNISAEASAPTQIYYHATKKAICIELDAANKSTAGVTIGVSIEDTSELGSAQTSVSLASNSDRDNGIFTKSEHGLSVNDRIIFAISANLTILSGSTDTNLSTTRYFFIASVPTANTFTIAETRSATVPIKFQGSLGTITNYKVIAIADVVREAPIPVGGALKIIAGQKLVLEATDRLFAYCSSTRNVDVVCSMLEDVS